MISLNNKNGKELNIVQDDLKEIVWINKDEKERNWKRMKMIDYRFFS